MVDAKLVERLVEAIDDFVSSSEPWQEKRDAVVEAFGDNDTNLFEFLTWFEGWEDEDDDDEDEDKPKERNGEQQ